MPALDGYESPRCADYDTTIVSDGVHRFLTHCGDWPADAGAGGLATYSGLRDLGTALLGPCVP